MGWTVEGQLGNSVKEKRIFNKKKWREEIYSNKVQAKKWEEIKKRKALRKYNKELKKSGIEFKDKNFKNESQKDRPQSTLKQAQLKYQQIQKEKEEKRKERERKEKERKEAIQAYKEKKAMRYKKLCQKTRKGQPLMKGRIELLLEQIEKVYGSNENKNS